MQPGLRIPAGIASIAHVILVATIPLLLLISPLYLFASPAFIRHEYGLAGFPPSERFSPQERARLARTIVLYVIGRETRANMASLRTDAGQPALLDEEVQHLVDVRVVMDGFRLVHGLGLAVGVLSALLLWLANRRMALALALRQGVWIAGGLIIFIVLASVIDFDTFFTRFHQLFFQEGTWVFYVEDTLIQLYPLPLWVDAVWKIGLVVLTEMGVLYATSMWLYRSAVGG